MSIKMVKYSFEIKFSHIINTNTPQKSIEILFPIFKEFRSQARMANKSSQLFNLQIKQMQLDYDKLLMRIT